MPKKAAKKSAHLVVRTTKDRKEVHRLDVGHLGERAREKVLSGMLINMNTDDYYVSEEMLPCAKTTKTS